MGKIVQTTDFVGKYSITQNSFGVSNLQAFIDKYEKIYLYDLLGIALGDLFYNDIAINTFLPPPTAEYATLFNRIYSDNGNSSATNQIRSDGIKEMLLGFIYFEYTRTQNVLNTPTGNIVASNEVSREAKWSETEIYNIYNEGLKTYKSIQTYIITNSATYPLFNGSFKSYASFIN